MRSWLSFRAWVICFPPSLHQPSKQSPRIKRRREKWGERGQEEKLPSWDPRGRGKAMTGRGASQHRERRPGVGWSCCHAGSGPASASLAHDYLATRKHLSHLPPLRRETQAPGAWCNAQICGSPRRESLQRASQLLPFPGAPGSWVPFPSPSPIKLRLCLDSAF